MIDALKKQLARPFEKFGQSLAVVEARLESIEKTNLDQIAALKAEVQEIGRNLAALSGTTEQLKDMLAQQNLVVLAAVERLAPSSDPLWDRGVKYRHGLNAVGVLNYENSEISGENRFLRHFLAQQPGGLVLDVGANTGQFCTMVRELGPSAKIHSFEPHPASFAKLKELSRTIDVTAHQLALGDSEGTIEIFDYADEAGSQHASVYREVIEGVHQRPASPTHVPCTTLDSFAAKKKLSRIGLLKIDTEGHELAVLRGSRKLLEKGAIDVIQFEFNEMNVISRVFMKDFFDILPNYRIFRLLPGGVIEFAAYDPTFMEVFAFQNIVCVRRDIDPHWLHGQ